MSASKNKQLNLIRARQKVDTLFLFLSKISYDNEVWKEYNPPNGQYFISSLSRVVSICRDIPIIKKQEYNSKGYRTVKLNKQKRLVHRVVAELFIPNPDNKDKVHHKDTNKNNNCVSNLVWLSNEEHNKEHKKLRQQRKQQKKEDTSNS